MLRRGGVTWRSGKWGRGGGVRAVGGVAVEVGPAGLTAEVGYVGVAAGVWAMGGVAVGVRVMRA
jgi:hypothetical protein